MSREKITKEPIFEKCIGCRHVMDDGFCRVYTIPRAKWRAGNCPMATHLEKEKVTVAQKKRLGQQHRIKQSKLSKKQQKTYSRLGKI